MQFSKYKRKVEEEAPVGQPFQRFSTISAPSIVGPVRPQQGAEYSDSSEDDAELIQKDPIYLQSIQNTKPMSSFQTKTVVKVPAFSETQECTNYLPQEMEFNPEVVQPTPTISKPQYNLPISLEVSLQGHTKTVSILAADSSGSRLFTGSYDYHIRIWDFHSMSQSLSSFRSFEPIEGHPTRALSFSKDNKNVLVVAGGTQVIILDRDGKKGKESVKGDMYITDMAKTKGHVSDVNDGLFSPSENNIFATCSQDHTIRIWDLNQKLIGIEQQMSHKSLIKCFNLRSTSRGHKCSVNTISFNSTSTRVFGGCKDGSIQIFSTKTNFHRPDISIVNAHEQNERITKLICLDDDKSLFSRSLDSTLKLWDLRYPKSAVNCVYNLPSVDPGPRIAVNGDQTVIVTATSALKDIRNKLSTVQFFDTKNLTLIKKVLVNENNISDMMWHRSLNQILFGNGNSVKVFFDAEFSKGGALLSVVRQPRQKQVEDVEGLRPEIAPHVLSLFKDDISKNKDKYLEKNKEDPEFVKAPIQPSFGKDPNAKSSSTITQFLVKTLNELPDKREDAQAALIRLEIEGRVGKKLFESAYKTTQPQPIFDTQTPEIEEQKFLSDITVICPACGLKLCTCKDKLIFVPPKERKENNKLKINID